MKKCGEKSYNKIFYLTINNDMVVIARISNPIASFVAYTTVLEDTIIDFVSNLVYSCSPH